MIILDELHDIRVAVKAVLNALADQNYSPYTVKVQENFLNGFLKYLRDNQINKIDKETCMKFIQFRTGTSLQDFCGKGNRKVNAVMKPIQNLFSFMENGVLIYQKRPMGSIPDFV
jgi:site-specific recombinase XerD